MRPLVPLASLVALVTWGGTLEAQRPGSTPVLHSVVYREHLITRTVDRSRVARPEVLLVRPLEDGRSRTLLDLNSGSRSGSASFFVRGRVLVAQTGLYFLSQHLPTMGHSNSTVTIEYHAADRVLRGRLVGAEPSGDPVGPVPPGERPLNVVWGRSTDIPVPLEDFGPGDTEVMHTAVAPDGPRDLVLFDLARTVPAAGKQPDRPEIRVTRITPEAKARPGGVFGMVHWGRPATTSLGAVAPRFDGPFEAYVVGDDYYFLTRAGVLHRSPPPASGQPRSTEVIWDRAERHVRFVISDAHRAGAHYLITPRRGLIGWDYFRLGPVPRPEELTDRFTPEVDRPEETAYDLAKLLREQQVLAPAGRP